MQMKIADKARRCKNAICGALMVNERVRKDPSETRMMFIVSPCGTPSAMAVQSQTIGFLLNCLRDLRAISMHVERIAALQQTYSKPGPGGARPR